MRVLVVGGAGYIGSHMVRQLAASGIDVTTLDILWSGHREAVRTGDFVAGDLGDRRLLDGLLVRTAFDGVKHFAAHIEVGESVRDPAKYYQSARRRADSRQSHPALVFQPVRRRRAPGS